MSMNTPIGNIAQTTPIKNFKELDEMQNEQYLLGIDNNTVGNGSKISLENLINSSISADSDNLITKGTDDRLLVNTPVEIGDLSNLTTTNKSTLVAAINEVDGDLSTEVTTRSNADNNLQSQIDAITASSDVTDIVGTYAELQAYDTTGLPDNSIIKVLQDESRQDETTYYRWVITGGVGAWVLIGEEGPYYTISQSDSKFATQATVGNLSNLATSDKSSVVNAMNELASVLDPTQTADYIKNSKAIYSGEVSENALILPQIKEMAHSTFDPSKFTVYGSPSPNITADGIASGFSSSGWLRCPSYNFVNTATLEFEFTPDKITNTGDLGLLGGGTDGGLILRQTDDKLRIFISVNGSSWAIGNVVIYSGLVAGTSYKVKIVFNSLGLIVYVNGTQEYSNQTVGKVYALPNEIGRVNFSGSIDLKQFSITVDGVEVFSGNKTGIDTIKPDDYTVVGSPTISDDGIASGFSNSNYLTTPNITINKPFELISPIFKANIPTDNNMHYILKDNNGDFRLAISSSGQIFCRLTINGSYAEYYTNCFINNGYCQSKLVYTGTQYLIYCRKLNDEWELRHTIDNTNLLTIGNVLYVGYHTNNNYIWQGSIDLNAIKIYIDGSLVYQPCLKIPYTESKTGSKIVGVNYRERVNDMAEQFGYAPYYTLSDTDFTLPQGELYGYLEKRARDIAHPVAEPFYRFTDEINDDEVRLEGAEVDKGLYLAIEQKLSAYCTAGTTPDKICLPDFRDRVPWGANSQGYINAGLPNIYGETGASSIGNRYPATGAFAYRHDLGSSTYGADGSGAGDYVYFNASTVSSIYGNSSTVQPPAFKVRWLARFK